MTTVNNRHKNLTPNYLTRCRAAVQSQRARGYRNAKGGKREDLGFYVRSKWEANYARYLKWLENIGEIARWEYEPDTFEFPIRRGTKFYTPDFKVFDSDGTYEYHEVKGWMNQRSKTQLKRMTKYYPDERVIVIDSDAYYALAKDVKRLVENWE